MHVEDRVEVGYVGVAPADWVTVFGQHSLLLKSVAAGDARVACEVGLRALVIPFKDWNSNRMQLSQLISTVDNRAANHGTLVVVAIELSPSEMDDYLNVSTSLADTRRPATQYVPIRVQRLLDNSAIRQLAELCRKHVPGPKANQSLESPLLQNGDISAPGATLLSRAFFDYAHLDVTILPGGRSHDSVVWLVKAQDHRRFTATPFVVKMGPLEDIAQELVNFEDMIMDSVPFPYRPPTIAQRSVTGKDRKLLVTKFISEAVSLEDYIRSRNPVTAIDLLFDGPLWNWRGQATDEKMQLAVEFETRWVLPNLAYGDDLALLKEAFAAASVLEKNVMTPEEMIRELKGLPNVEVKVCKAHGDMHLRNIFVRERSGEVMLIDFRLCTPQAPSSYDPSTLDVALAFDHPDDGERFSVKTLLHIYAPPVLGTKHISDKRQKHRLMAIRRVRKRASDLAGSLEYDIAIACRLLWYARKLKNPAAYLCANRIVRSLIRT